MNKINYHHLSLIFLLLFLLFDCKAQIKSLKWYSGNKSGISFKGPSNQILTDNPCISQEGNVTITDDKGNLVLFACGNTIYNRDLTPMKNGTGLFGNTNGSSAQSPLVLQDPGNENLLYIFYISEHVGNFVGDLRYSIINMCGDNGKGEVLNNKKNIKLPGSYTERVSIVPIIHQESYWLVACSNKSYLLNSFKIDKNGINLTPIQSNLGVSGIPEQIGMINFNNDFTRFVFTTSFNSNIGAYLANFDKNSGLVSNFNKILDENLYDATFSNNGKYIYITDFFAQSTVIKYDIANKSSKIIFSSGANYDVLAIEKGPDANIYFSSASNGCICRIRNIDSPNENIELNHLCAQNANISQNVNFFYGFKFQSTYDSVTIYKCPNESISYEGITYVNEGEYTIDSSNPDECNAGTKLFIKDRLTTFSSTILEKCEGQEIAINNEIFSNFGEFTQILKNKDGCDSILFIKIIPKTIDFKLSNYKKVICAGEEITVNIETENTNSIEWYINGVSVSKGKTFSHKPKTQDSIWFEIKNSLGCVSREIISFDVVDIDQITFNTEQINICSNDSIFLEIENIQGITFSWVFNDSIIGDRSNLKFKFNKSGVLFLKIKLNDCTKTFERKIEVNPNESFDFPNIPNSICLGDSIFLQELFDLGINQVNIKFGSEIIEKDLDYFIPSTSDNLSITGIDKFGCLVKKNYIVNVVEQIIPHFELSFDYCLNKLIILPLSKPNSFHTNIIYDKNGKFVIESQSDTLYFDFLGRYTVERINNLDLDCETRISKEINIENTSQDFETNLPNIIRINSEINNLFCSPETAISLSIYDRWGSLMFISENNITCWDGKINNDKVAEGVYTYVMKYIEQGCDRTIKIKTGDITVLH